MNGRRLRISVLFVGFVCAATSCSDNQMMVDPPCCQPIEQHQPLFEARRCFPVADRPTDLCSGDVDGDGDRDLAVIYHLSKELTILTNDGTGQFETATGFTFMSRVGDIEFADMDGDGDIDIAAVLEIENTVAVLKNNGSGVFDSVEYFQTIQPSGNPINLVARDMNRDRKIDIVVASTDSSKVGVMLNDGSGKLGPPSFYDTHDRCRGIYSADLDGDGSPDIVTTALFSAGFSVMLNDGAGLLGEADFYNVYASRIVLTDVDGDGDREIATGRQVLPNNGDGTFGAPLPVTVSTFSDAMAATDFDRDGDIDLVGFAPTGPVNVLFLMLNNGSGNYDTADQYVTGAAPRVVVPGDYDGDGDADLLTTEFQLRNVALLSNKGDGTLVTAREIDIGRNSFSMTISDLNEDGFNDMVVAYGKMPAELGIKLNRGDGTFTATTMRVQSLQSLPFHVHTSDLDGDGDQDLVTANGDSGNNITVLLNDGRALFGIATNYAAGNRPACAISADIDKDGDEDILVANRNSNDISILSNQGDGTFDARASYNVDSQPRTLCKADFNDDGNMDIAVGNEGGGTVSVLLNNGDGTFMTATDYTGGGGIWSVAQGDIDGDGDRDLVTANHDGDDISVLLNDGSGVFSSGGDHPTGDAPSSAALADLDQDGDIDIVVSNMESDNVTVFLNDGDGTLAPAMFFGANIAPTSVAIGDIDGDGDGDLAVINRDSDTVSIIINSINDQAK